jgi:inactivated superfamily I helicase
MNHHFNRLLLAISFAGFLTNRASAQDIDLESTVPPAVRARWETDSRKYARERERRQAEAKQKFDDRRNRWEKLKAMAASATPDEKRLIRDEQIKMVREWETLLNDCLRENLRQLAELRKEYGRYSELAEKLDDHLAVTRDQIERNTTSANKHRERLSTGAIGGEGVIILGNQDRKGK